ncbi:4-hydroxyphenylpyruvate dioxygenase [Pelobates cultripes]|uniref:4-hydroxyphenylpyruvate dioxygenase n=1 Tax=Pelobates cultripes TaxID=61616 RepID=A0AAD1WJZ1_PELCU|nr:4-hydroxyphenylpyruvate dioxygenase [Pelobates cultripes]
MTSRLIRLSHIILQVSNAERVVQELMTKYQFQPFAARGLDGRSPSQVALRNGGVVFMVNENNQKTTKGSSMLYDATVPLPYPDTACNVSFDVEDVPGFCQRLLSERCQLLVPPTEVHDDYGLVTFCVVKSVVGNVRHTLIDRTRYGDNFLPEFQNLRSDSNPVVPGDLTCIDHVTYACPRGSSPHIIKWYERCFGFKHFPLSKEEDCDRGFEISGPNIGLRLTAMDSPELGKCGKLVLAESLPQKGINQLDLFLNHHKEGGIQHVGLFATDIFKTARSMANQGVCFTSQPPTYYSDPSKQEEIQGVGLQAEILSQFGILLDSKSQNSNMPNGYLLQVFAEPLWSKDSFYLELIERRGADGFGEGNVRALWRALNDFLEGSTQKDDEKIRSTAA